MGNAFVPYGSSLFVLVCDDTAVAEVEDDGSVGEVFRQWSDGGRRQEGRLTDVVGEHGLVSNPGVHHEEEAGPYWSR